MDKLKHYTLLDNKLIHFKIQYETSPTKETKEFYKFMIQVVKVKLNKLGGIENEY